MAAPVGPKKVHRYTLEFKIQAVRLANHPEIQTQDVAQALDIHPSNALEDLLPLVPAGLTAIATVRPGQVVRVEA